MANVDTGASRPPPPLGSTLDVSLYIVITNGEEGWEQKNYYVTYRTRQRHYFHCPCNYPSGEGASSVHGSTTRPASVSSWFRRQRQQSLVLYRSTNIHGSSKGRAYVSIPIYCCSSNLYFICLIMLFDDPFVIMVYILYFISFFVHYTILISIICIFYIILLNILLFI